jgi:hypothetical protein
MLISLRTLLATLPSPQAREPGYAPPNRRASAVREKASEIDFRGPSVLFFLSHFWRDWRSALVIVKPETVVAWHRSGFRLFWTWKVRRGQRGRPVVSREFRELIRQMCRESPTLGVHPASTVSCSNSASTSARAVSASTWCAAASRGLGPGALSWKTISRSWFPSTSSLCPLSVSRFSTCFWYWPMTAGAFFTSM